jgi:hypothetical protein
MAIKFYTNINLNRSQLQNVAIENASTDPGTTTLGHFYFNTTNNRIAINKGTSVSPSWVQIPYAGSIVNTDFASQATANRVLASPTSGSGTPTFRQIVVGDIDTTSVRLDTVGSATGTISAGTSGVPQKIQYVATPTADNDAANKSYVDAAVANLNVHAPVVAATTADLGNSYTAPNGNGIGAYLTVTATSSTLTIDGKLLTAGTNYTGDRILVKNQTTQTQNGVYYLDSFPTSSTAKLIRDTDYDGSVTGEVANGDYIFVLYGGQKSTAWIQSGTNPLTVGTSNLTFTQFTQLASYTGSNGVKLVNGTDFQIDNTTVPVASSTGSGKFVLDTSPTLTTPTIGVATATSVNKVTITAPSSSATLTLFNGSTLATGNANSVTFSGVSGGSNVNVPSSGTLATTPTGTNQSLPTKYVTTFNATSGNVSKVIPQATHGLSSNRNLIVQVSDSSGNVVYTDIVISAAGQVTITFADVAASYDTYDITIIG